jgi:hypothetical protein
MIFGIPLALPPSSFFLQEVLNEDVKHVDIFSRLQDVHVVFGIIFLMFCPKAFIFVSLLPSLLGFHNQFVVFYLTLMRVFEKKLGLSSLECLETILVLRQMAFPIFSGGIRLISSKIIARAT